MTKAASPFLFRDENENYHKKRKRNSILHRKKKKDVPIRYILSPSGSSGGLNDDVTSDASVTLSPSSKQSKNKQSQSRNVLSPPDYRADINHPLIIILRRPTFQYIAEHCQREKEGINFLLVCLWGECSF